MDERTRHFYRWLSLCGALLLCIAAPARADVSAAALDRLAQDPYWLELLHMRQHGAHERSRAHGGGFFRAADGAVNPQAELLADIAAWRQAPLDGDAAAACLLPARYAWVRRRLPTLTLPPPPSCPQLQRWLQALAVQRITLVFASDYVNNPSSMFGHTFLRLDNRQADQDPLLTYAISYAAATHESNGLLFAVRGLTGGYPGMYSLLPYYDKVKQYNDFENRDLWEYGLDLDQREIQRILLHVWELRQVAFPYYFFSDNCAYELLKLLDIGRPSLHLSRHFHLYTIPADSVRAITAVPGLVVTRHYRPAQSTRLAWRVRTNSAAVDTLAERLYADPTTPLSASFSLDHQAQALETAFDALKLHQDRGELSMRSDPGKDLSLLLLRRARIDLPDQSTPPPTAATDPSQGHDSSHLLLATGTRQGGTFDVGWRPAYHDPSDASAGYRQGASIDFLDLDLQYRQSDRQWHLDHATLLAIQSLSPSLPFQRSLSWQMGVSAEDLPLQGHTLQANASHILLRLHGGVGMSWIPSAPWQVWTLADVQTLSGAGLSRPSLGVGPDLGFTYHHGAWQTCLDVRAHQSSGLGWLAEPSLSLDDRLRLDESLRLSTGMMALAGRRLAYLRLAWIHDF